VAIYDVVVIGSGSAGTAAALGCRKQGRSVAVIERGPLGGTCVLRGCDPKKVLVEAAAARDATLRYAELDIFRDAPTIVWPALARFKRSFTDPAPQERARTYDDAGIVTLHGEATFSGERTLDVNGTPVEAGAIVVATGAHPRHVAQGDASLLTSEAFLDLDEMPPSLVFIGGGYIALEFAHIALRAGSQVTILNDGPDVLEGFDPVLTRRLRAYSVARGIAIETDTRVERVEPDGEGVIVHARSGERASTFRAAAGVLAAGRVPDLDALQPARAGVAFGSHGITVNDHLQSLTNPYVYAAGDCADDGGKPLTPVASAQGDIVAHNLTAKEKRRFDSSGLVSIVYTIPPLATVGPSEKLARARGIDLDVHEGDTGKWYSSRSTASSDGYFRVFTDRSSGCVIGGSIFGMHAEEQINVLALAVRAKVPATVLADTLFGYPTGSSDMPYLLGLG
jgi:glutathione reductase (NADPH)